MATKILRSFFTDSLKNLVMHFTGRDSVIGLNYPETCLDNNAGYKYMKIAEIIPHNDLIDNEVHYVTETLLIELIDDKSTYTGTESKPKHIANIINITGRMSGKSPVTDLFNCTSTPLSISDTDSLTADDIDIYLVREERDVNGETVKVIGIWADTSAASKVFTKKIQSNAENLSPIDSPYISSKYDLIMINKNHVPTTDITVSNLDTVVKTASFKQSISSLTTIRNSIERLNAKLIGFRADDKDFDNSPILQNWLDNLTPDSPALYFPNGVYYFKSPVTLNKHVVGCTITGDSAPRDFVYISKKTGLPVGYNSTVLYFSADDTYTDPTFFTQVSNSPINFSNLVFLSDSFKWTFDSNFNYRPSVPYNIFTYDINKENCSAVDISTYTNSSISNCLFYGFSGHAIKTTKQNTFHNCKISNCNTGILIDGHDCTFYDIYISNCVNGIVLTEDAATIFAWSLWVDCCAEYAIKAANTLNGVIECIIDHINYSAIYAKLSTHLKVDGRINRCGMQYSGFSDWASLENDDLDIQFENFAKAATISIHTCHNCSFDLETVTRGLADSGEQLYYTPNVMFNSASWRKNIVQIPSDDIAEYEFWKVAPVIYKTAYTHKGISDGANIHKLNKHTENGCSICAYNLNGITYVDVRGTIDNDSMTFPFDLFTNVDIQLLKDIAPIKIPIIASAVNTGSLISYDGIKFTYYNINGKLENGNSIQGHITSLPVS